MKVLMVVGQFYPIAGGTERECQKLAARFIRRGEQVMVLTQFCPGRPAFEVIEGIPVYRKMKGWHFHEYTYMLSVLWFLIWKVREYDIIQCFGLYLFIPPAALIKYIFRKKVLARIEGSGAYGDFHRIGKLKCGGLILASAGKLDGIISIAAHIGEEIVEHGLSAQDMVTIPNSVDTEVYRPANDRCMVQGKTLCFAGRLAEEKGLFYLIKAMKDITARLEGVSLVLVGDGELREPLERLRDSLCLQKEVIFAGNDIVLPYYHTADLFVLPSLSEGLSLSLLEAMACGLPVIATAVGGTRAVLDPFSTVGEIPPSHYKIAEHGMLVNPADIEGLAKAALRLFEDAELSRRLKLTARDHVRKVYDLDRIADEYLSLYRIRLEE